MVIQILKYNTRVERYADGNMEVNRIHDAKSLDDFNINVIDLNDSDMWVYNGSKPVTIDSIADIKSLATMISNSKKTTVVVLLPQNLRYAYNYTAPRHERSRYLNFCELKNATDPIIKKVTETLFGGNLGMEILYENTESKIENENIKAAFYFNDKNGATLIRSTSGKKGCL